MNALSTPRDKAAKPHAHFDGPREVVADPALSKAQKSAALDSLEQDARQMAVASAEGMSGGESGKLHDVLEAKGALELPPTEYAYALVVQDLQSRRAAALAGDAHTALDHALVALQEVMRLPPPAVALAAAAEARAEADDEIARERLDP